MKTYYSNISTSLVSCPWLPVILLFSNHQLQLHTVRIIEKQYLLVKYHTHLRLNTITFKSLFPEIKTPRRHRISSMSGHTRTIYTLANALPREKSNNCSRCPLLVTKIKVVSARIIKVHRLFHKPETKHVCIKIMITLCTVGYCSNMMQS